MAYYSWYPHSLDNLDTNFSLLNFEQSVWIKRNKYCAHFLSKLLEKSPKKGMITSGQAGIIYLNKGFNKTWFCICLFPNKLHLLLSPSQNHAIILSSTPSCNMSHNWNFLSHFLDHTRREVGNRELWSGYTRRIQGCITLLLWPDVLLCLETTREISQRSSIKSLLPAYSTVLGTSSKLILEESKFLLYLVEIGIVWKLLGDREIGRKDSFLQRMIRNSFMLTK